ncbi:hypothetical protein [Bacillus arachidis]|uniref:Uncharacterized protein n=1 Tax=Bacillus arachidis TaxID=2819290 RepID=A0ABS3P126_9BACI|nr:hypothetical protein [Bacillus arachidis]MBO1626894.1 hypothetical protein [Bacillus arachidis]WIY61880.1 hypothetical protein QRY57_04890 [Bacillus arachidis]
MTKKIARMYHLRKVFYNTITMIILRKEYNKKVDKTAFRSKVFLSVFFAFSLKRVV